MPKILSSKWDGAPSREAGGCHIDEGDGVNQLEVSHQDVTLTGIIEERIRELDGAEHGSFGAIAELHLRVSPAPSAAWRALWRSDVDAPEVIRDRTEVSDSGFIVLAITESSDIEADTEAIVDHTIRTNHRWHDLNQLARSSAERAVAFLQQLSSE
jgi:hypothetical protein